MNTYQRHVLRNRDNQRGQVLVIFAGALVLFMLLTALSIDLGWYWANSIKVQRAADAAALAGAVYLPDNVPGGQAAAYAAAKQNGYVTGAGTTVTATQDGSNPRQMDVTIIAPINTFFLRVANINSLTITKNAMAEYVLPVPMGSPENYYGSFGPYPMCTSSSCTSDTTVTLAGPSGQTMTARGFWGSELTQGAAFINGDAYLPKDNAAGTPSTGTNPQHDTTNYYDYAVYMPPGTSGGRVWIFDPGFCATDGRRGTGDRWFEGTAAVSAYYYLYNTNNSPYNLGAQTLLGSSGGFFANMRSADSLAGGASLVGGGVTECKAGTTSNQSDPRYWHNQWWDLTAYIGTTLSGGTGGTTYRIRTTTDPGNTSQDSTDATNDFAIYASATGGSPQVYGVGSMQMYTPLAKNTSSTFYLAQISQQAGAGKTVEINLWDPGDTNNVPATMKVLAPTAGGWSAISLTWTANRLASGGSNCVGGSGSSILTNNGSTSFFNGCWVHISFVVPATYTAPQSGWWKIEYDMGNCTGGTCYSTDETTWSVDIRGNPVHLVAP